MPVSSHKFLLIPLILGIGVQTFISCTLHFPEEGLISSSSVKNSSSSSPINPSGSSSAQNQVSSNSDSDGSSSSLEGSLSSSGISSSSNTVSSSSSIISSSSTQSSSSIAQSSSSVCTAKDNTQTGYCSGGAMKEYGSMTQGDKTYKTVVIGTQTWMAENLNFTPTSGKSKCYAEGNGIGTDTWLAPGSAAAKANCDKYGRLYDWAAATTVCPSGWKLPDTSDWGKLRRFIEKEIFDNWEDIDFGWDVATKLKTLDTTLLKASTDKGVDSYGFRAIGTGYCVNCEALSDGSGYYEGEKTEAHWWSGTEYVNKNVTPNDKTQAYKAKITYNKNVMTLEHEKKTEYLYSVRCIKN